MKSNPRTRARHSSWPWKESRSARRERRRIWRTRRSLAQPAAAPVDLLHQAHRLRTEPMRLLVAARAVVDYSVAPIRRYRRRTLRKFRQTGLPAKLRAPCHLARAASRLQINVGSTQRHRTGVTSFLNSQAMRHVGIGLILIADFAFASPPLQRGHAIAVQTSIGVSRIAIERLPNHEHDFAMSHRALHRLRKLNGGGQRDIAGGFFQT